MYLLNRLPTMAIQATCPHLALFGSVPSYEHLRIFGCTCYPNMTATAPHKLSPHSTRCVFLGYSADHKGYRCLDLSTNRLIISRHMVFDEDNFPLTTSPSLIDLDFLCESDPTVSTIGNHLTTTGTSTPAPHRPASEIPPGFEPPVAPLPDCATYHHRRPATSYMVDLTSCLCPTPSVASVGEYHFTAPSSAPFRGWLGRGGTCHAAREST
jgi:hypothetical protein